MLVYRAAGSYRFGAACAAGVLLAPPARRFGPFGYGRKNGMSVEVKALEKRFGSFGVSCVDLSLRSDEILVLAGPSGCGNT